MDTSPIKEKNHFLITSSGQMATFWLASQLNKHPKIFCSHSYDNPAWGAVGSPLRGKDGERQRAVIKERFNKLSLKHFFDENAAVTEKTFIGNVHAYNVESASNMVAAEQLTHVKIVNLIRHPLTRINSLFNCIKNEWFEFRYFDHLTFVPKIYMDHGRDLVKSCYGSRKLREYDDSLEKQFFVVSIILERGAANHVNIANDMNIPNIKYEDITTNNNTMIELVNHINATSLDGTQAWLNHDIAYKKLNSHSNTANKTIKSTFSSWEKWMQKLYNHAIKDKSFEVYLNNYYDFIRC